MLGDDDGVLAVAIDDCRAVIEAAEAKQAAETKQMAAIEAGTLDRSWVDVGSDVSAARCRRFSHGRRTISEKILARKSGRMLGPFVVCEVALGTDGSVPMALDYFKAMGGENVRDAARLVFALDHYAPPTSPQTIELHRVMRDFARRFSVTLH